MTEAVFIGSDVAVVDIHPYLWRSIGSKLVFMQLHCGTVLNSCQGVPFKLYYWDI
jgi:hypothetical protein